MFTEMFTAYKNLQAAAPKTFEDLQQEISAFAAKHQATPDVVFEVLFNHLHNRISTGVGTYESLDDVEAQELLFMEKYPYRPVQCALVATTDPANCRIGFYDLNRIESIMGGYTVANEAIQNMLAVFVTDIMFPGYKYNDFSALGGGGSSKFSITKSQLFPTKHFKNYEEEAKFELEREKAVEDEAQRLLGTEQNAAPADMQRIGTQLFITHGVGCDIPNSFMINFLNSPAAEAAMQRVKADPKLWPAYDRSIPDVQADFSIGGLSDSAGITVMLVYSQLVTSLEEIAAQFNINTQYSDIFEHSLIKMYEAGEKPSAPCKFFSVEGSEPYALQKRNFLVRPSISKEAMQRLVNNINARLPNFPNAAKIYDQDDRMILLSFAFVQQDFLPRFADFLANNPELVAEMQAMQQAAAPATAEADDSEEFDDDAMSNQQSAGEADVNKHARIGNRI